MRVVIRSVTFLAAVLLMAPAYARNPIPTPQDAAAADADDPSIAEVMARYIEASGGAEAHAALENRRSTGTLTFTGIFQDVPLTLYHARPGQVKMVVEVPAVGMVERATDGRSAWEVAPGGGREIEGQERDEFLLHCMFDFDLRFHELFENVEYAGVQEVAGRPCHVLRADDGEGHVVTRYFDKDTGLIARDITVAHQPAGAIQAVADYLDYREVDSVKLPHRIEERTGGMEQVQVYQTIEHNVDLPADTFSVPATIRAAADLAAPTEAQQQWLREHALPFETVEADNGFEDLRPLEEIIGDARIVSLGESTHGSREIFQMKHRLVEFLAAEMGFTIFSIEANMPESYRLNDYVVDGQGDPAQLIAGMYFWTWRTEEVLAMVEWMRRFNQEHAGDPERGITFTGFDMQTPDVARQIARDFAVETGDGALQELLDALPASLRDAASSGAAAFTACTGIFPVEDAAGRTVTFSGWIRTENLDGWAAIWWRADGPGQGEVAAFDNMHDRAPRGDTPWTHYQLTLDVPEDIHNINFGMLVGGDGTAWFDDLHIEIDGRPYEHGGRFELAFEQKHLVGFSHGSPGYSTTIVDTEPHGGNGCLQVQRVAQAADDQGAGVQRAAALVDQAMRHMEENREAYADRFDAERIEWAIQNTRILQQFLAMSSAGGAFVHRDRSMAENIRWILEQNPDARIVLWAHNGHVNTVAPAMGGHLEEWYGDDHLAVGFVTGRGWYTAIGDGGLGSHQLQEPPETSIEAFFAAAGQPRSILDLRLAAASDSGSSWLTESRPIRSIGALVMDQQFRHAPVRDQFELLIWIDHTGAAVQLP